jgi:hypothetical protein
VPGTCRQGKSVVAAQVYGPDEVVRATLVTDGGNGQTLLNAVARPVVVWWPNTDARSASSRLYLPFL